MLSHFLGVKDALDNCFKNLSLDEKNRFERKYGNAHLFFDFIREMRLVEVSGCLTMKKR
jgi:hypothetical protein